MGDVVSLERWRRGRERSDHRVMSALIVLDAMGDREGAAVAAAELRRRGIDPVALLAFTRRMGA